MTFDVPAASHYGGCIIDESGRVLLRKTAKLGEGYFFRWRRNSEKTPDQLVQSSIKAEFGVGVDIIDCDQGVAFIDEGTLVNFVMCYVDGDVEAGGLQWLDISSAWKIIEKSENHNVLIADVNSLGLAIDWCRKRERKTIESAMGVAQKEWYDKFNHLCDGVHDLLSECPNVGRGDGVSSTFIQSIIKSTHLRAQATEGYRDYVSDLFRRVEKPSRSGAYEEGLIEVIQIFLTEAHDQLEVENYDGFLVASERVSEYLNLYRDLYNCVSPAIRRRAIDAGRARGKDRRDLESIMLEVLARRAPYRRREQREEIGEKIFEEILAELARRDVAQSWSRNKLRSALRDFLIVNKAAQKILPS